MSPFGHFSCDKVMNSKKKQSKKRSPKPAAGKPTLENQIEYFVRYASQHVRRVAGLRRLVFFSTETGDAWMLDPDNGVACPLAREGSPSGAGAVEAGDRTTVEWNCAYQIRDETFIFADRSGRTTAVLGYPIREILRAIRQREKTG